jgi:hypothetical protein
MPNLLNSYGRTTAFTDNSGYVVLNLSGAQKFEEDTVFPAGKYKIEIAPGAYGYNHNYYGSGHYYIANMVHMETITEPFFIRAYCGSSGNFNNQTAGVNLYSGAFKVNGIDARLISRDYYPNGVDVNHIFGAGGGNSRYYNSSSETGAGTSWGGGPNCLGNGNIECYSDYGTGNQNAWGGAGSCLHLIPVGGIFGTNYLRAYHLAPLATHNGSAYGGGQGNKVRWGSRGGNSPYGNGSQDEYSRGVWTFPDTGIGGGNKNILRPDTLFYGSPGAYFNGFVWVDEPGFIPDTGNNSSYIRITYLGPINE